jgi:hypothetical protein
MSDKRIAEEGRFAGLALAEESWWRAWPGATTTTA